MAASTRNRAGRHAGSDWLARCAPDPTRIHRAWEADDLASLKTGREWLAAEVDLLRSVDALQRIPAGRVGPVLVHPTAGLAWWLVPHEAAEQLADEPRIVVHVAGWPLRCPPADSYCDGLGWLEKPDGTGLLTDPYLLAAALGPGGRLPAAAFS